MFFSNLTDFEFLDEIQIDLLYIFGPNYYVGEKKLGISIYIDF